MSKLWPSSAASSSSTSSGASNGGGGGGSSSSNSNNNNNNANGEGGTLTRTVLVHISGNRATWEHMGMHGAMWQINPDRAAYIFADGPPSTGGSACGNNNNGGGPGNNNNAGNNNNNGGGGGGGGGNEWNLDMAGTLDKLSRAMIRRVTLLESNTNIDEVVAVQIDGLPPREFTKNGEGASVFLTGEGRITQPQELFQMSGNTELGMKWMRQFPRYTTTNLEEIGVVFLTGASYYFVHQEHPVIHFLRANEDQLGIQIFQEPSLEGEWFRVDVDTFIFTVRNLRETVLRNTPSTFNLNTLTVRVSKPEAQRWLQLCPQLINSLLSDEVRESGDPELVSEARRLGIQRYFDRPVFVTLRLSIEYALPETASAPPAAPSASQIASMSGSAINSLPASVISAAAGGGGGLLMGGGGGVLLNGQGGGNNGNNNNNNSANAGMMMMMGGGGGPGNNNSANNNNAGGGPIGVNVGAPMSNLHINNNVPGVNGMNNNGVNNPNLLHGGGGERIHHHHPHSHMMGAGNNGGGTRMR